MKGGLCRADRALLLLVPLTIFAAHNARGEPSAFPIFHYQQGVTTATYSLWSPWPFVEVTRTTDSLTYGLHPLFSWYKNRATGQSVLHILWPFLRRTFRPSTFKGENWRVLYLFPILYFGHGQQEGQPVMTRYLLPIFYQGREGPGRGHFILFPFIWYARDAHLVWPLFPTRPQTFVALWPLYGDFRGYWNRDRIVFLFWPLFVGSQKGRGADAVYLHSFLWPFFSIYSGKGISGFRIWPLFSYVKRKGQFFRSYWLWPLGHRRTGLTADGKTTQSMTVFLPFYANVKRGNSDWKLFFPFYGSMRTGKKTAKGYLLALYNTMNDARTGITERRLFWFLIRWRTRTPPAPEKRAQPGGKWKFLSPRSPGESRPVATRDQPTSGLIAGLERAMPPPGGPKPGANLETGFDFFPIYGRMSSSVRIRSFMLWPLYIHNWDRTREFDFDRRYFAPFYSSQERRWNDGAISRSRFFFPFFKSSIRRDGWQHRHWLHLWWYDQLDGLDRNYAPLWTFYEKDWNDKTGAKQIRVMKGLYEYDRLPNGWTRKSFNFLVFSTESTPQKTDTELFWGLLGYRRQNNHKSVRLLWFLNL